MIIIDTPFHITFSDNKELPKYACTGKCKKSWWINDFKLRNKKKCPQCGSDISEAIENVHFKVLNKSNRKLKVSDLKKYKSVSHKEKLSIKQYLDKGMGISHLSSVKPKFEKKALEEWC